MEGRHAVRRPPPPLPDNDARQRVECGRLLAQARASGTGAVKCAGALILYTR